MSSPSDTVYLLHHRLDETHHATILVNLAKLNINTTPSPSTATTFLADVVQSRRAKMELQSIGLHTEDLSSPSTQSKSERTIEVLKLAWYEDLLKSPSAPLDRGKYVVYRGRVVDPPKSQVQKPAPQSSSQSHGKHERTSSPPSAEEDVVSKRRGIMNRAMQDGLKLPDPNKRENRRFGRDKSSRWSKPAHKPIPMLQHARLQDTVEYEEEEAAKFLIPDPPDWVVQKKLYACQRSTPKSPPADNVSFIEALKKIRLNRNLISDDIGVRAYSTAIAAVCAYPCPIISPLQISSLPGCSQKIALLWTEMYRTGSLTSLREIEGSEYFRALEFFWNIWGVGATTAREFWRLGYRDLDDLVTHHWERLTRVQQIGVKYYQEFLDPIPRPEVQEIYVAIQDAARIVLPGAEACIVGGYRRGKDLSGDVDILISHPEIRKGMEVEDMIYPLVELLEKMGLLTHVLTIHSPRNHLADEVGGVSVKTSHHNFDGIPKVLCVYQSPYVEPEDMQTSKQTMGHSQSQYHSERQRKDKKNPNPHRRVDILFPPPLCLGTTLTSWSGATTFERDIRRYVRHQFGWKFSSEGLADRGTGLRIPMVREGRQWVGTADGGKVEAVGERGRTEGGEWIGWEVEERKVFETVGLEWREPTERWTW